MRFPSLITARFLAWLHALRWAAMFSLYPLRKKSVLWLSSWVTAIKRWPRWTKWDKPLIKSLIKSNTPPPLHPALRFLLICHRSGSPNYSCQLIDPLSSCRANFMSPWTPLSLLFLFAQSGASSQEKTFVDHPVRTEHPRVLLSFSEQTVTLLLDQRTSENDFIL